jgi:serine/threonine-protein kinase
MFAGLKAFSHRHSNQPSQLVPVDSESMITPGKLLNGRYKIMRALGAGGFSQTYLAKDIHRPSNPTCVVKHFKPASSDQSFLQTAQRLFQAEAEILEEIGHHNQVPQLLAYFEEKQNFYLAEEYVDGQLLSTEMLPGRCWSESRVIQLLQDVLDLLVFIHSHGVIHRDIKPDNLIRRKQDKKLVLIDFGTIKQVRTQTVTPQGHRIATTPIGTQGYMAAEQGQGNPRPSSDLYALGIISIQALTGLDPTQLQQDLDTGEICWQQQARVSPELEAIVGKLASYHFKDRYQSAVEVLEALQPLKKTHSNSPRHLYSQLEIPTQKSSNSSIPLSGIPSSEPTPGAVFPINPSEEPTDLDVKSKKWVWTGVGTGLASAVALSAVISSIPDTPVQSAAKPNNLVQNTAKPDSPVKNTPVKGVATSSTPLQRELTQTTNARPIRTSEPIPSQSEPRIAREQPSSPTVEKPRVISATANQPAQQARLRSIGEQPSSRPTEKQRVIAATTSQPTKERSSLEAVSSGKSDQSVKETQGASESNVDNNQAKRKSLAELKVAFGKLADAIAIADEALGQGQEAAQGTFDDLDEAIAKLQQQVETLPSKPQQNLTVPAISLNQTLVPSLDGEVAPDEKPQEEVSSTKQPEIPSEEQEEKITPADSSTKEQKLSPEVTFTEELDPASNEEVVPAVELEEEAVPTAEPEIMSTPTPESTPETMPEDQLDAEIAPASSSTEELSPEATSEDQSEEATPTKTLEEAVTPVSTEESASFEAVPEEQPKLSKELMENQNAFPTDHSTENLEEEVFEEIEETPANSSAEESLNSETISAEELEVASDSEVVSEEPLEAETASTNSPVISPDGQFLAGNSGNNTIKIWNVQTGELVSTLKGYSSGVQSVAFSSDSQTLISTGADGTTTTWNLWT